MNRPDLTRARRVLAVAGDAGGARALGPVIRALRALPNVSVEARAYGAAIEVWRSECLDAQPIASDDPAGFDRVLLGTSFLGERWELCVLLRARAAGIASLVVVDFWSQYRERFTLPGGQVIVPDRVAVVDEAMRRELVQAGFPAAPLVITGQPAFESLHGYSSAGQRQAARTALRAHTAPPFSGTCVLYISQPLSLQYSAAHSNGASATNRSALRRRRAHCRARPGQSNPGHVADHQPDSPRHERRKTR